MQRVSVDQTFTSSPAQVFAFLSEHENLGPLFGARVRRLTDGSDGTRNGVGSSREMKVGPAPPFVETVTESVPDELIKYRITKGSPLRDHEGVMRLEPHGDGGTRLKYDITFRGVVPGVDRLVAFNLRRSIPKGLQKIDRSI